MLDKLSAADFAAHQGQTFRVYYGPLDAGQVSEAETRDVELVSVTELGQADAAATQRRPFSLVFCDRSGAAYLPQRIYAVEHAGLGRLDLFLVPIGPGHGGMQYEAVFN
jgi:hypothetical protein